MSEDGIRARPAQLPRWPGQAPGLGAEAAGDGEALHDAEGQERQGVRIAVAQHQPARGPARRRQSGRLHQHRLQGDLQGTISSR